MILASVFLKKVKLSEKKYIFPKRFSQKALPFSAKKSKRKRARKNNGLVFFIFYSVFPRRKAEKNQYFVIFTDLITIGDFGTFTEIEE